MRTMGIKRGDVVLLIERRGEEQVVYNALVSAISMDELLAGTKGEGAIEVAFVATESERPGAVLVIPDVVHFSHRDWIEGRAGLAYEEMPYIAQGVCRFCRCTERRACEGGCSWKDMHGTVCSAQVCRDKYEAAERGEREVDYGARA